MDTIKDNYNIFLIFYKEKNYWQARKKMSEIISYENYDNISAYLRSDLRLEDKKLYTKIFYAICDTVYNTFSEKDLCEFHEDFQKVDLINSAEIKKYVNWNHIKTLVHGDFSYLEFAIKTVVHNKNIDLSLKFELFNTYKREFYDFRRSIPPLHMKEISDNLLNSLTRYDRIRENFRMEINKYLVSLFEKQYTVNTKAFSSNSGTIVFILEDFYSLSRSTVNKLILDWIYCIGEYTPEIKIEILITLDFMVNGDVIVGQTAHDKVDLETMMNELKLATEYTNNISLVYRNPDIDLLEWLSINIDVSSLLSLVMFPSPRWPLAAALNKFYPVVAIELANGVNLNEMADIVLPNGVVTDKTIAKYGNKIYQADFPQIPFPKQKNYDRRDFSISTDSVVVIGVGRQLVVRAGDKWESYIKEVITVLDEEPKSIWVFVGERKKNFSFNENQILNDYYKNNRILVIEDEEDLVALYEVCDIFAMPPIGGGGRGIGLATSTPLPCVSLNISDGAKSLPKECIFTDQNEYFSAIKELIENKSKRIDMANLCKEVFGSELLKKAAIDMKTACEIANKNFLKKV